MDKEARLEVIDILEKMNLFQGQRAGRELWNDKPTNVQEQDIDNFNRDIRTIRDYIWDLEHKLKAYEDAEEQGLLLRLPCKVGDTLYEPRYSYINEYKVIGLIYDIVKGKWKYELAYQNGVEWARTIYAFEFIGTAIFLTKEEAEQKLAEMQKE